MYWMALVLQECQVWCGANFSSSWYITLPFRRLPAFSCMCSQFDRSWSSALVKGVLLPVGLVDVKAGLRTRPAIRCLSRFCTAPFFTDCSINVQETAFSGGVLPALLMWSAIRTSAVLMSLVRTPPCSYSVLAAGSNSVKSEAAYRYIFQPTISLGDIVIDPESRPLEEVAGHDQP